MAIVKILDNFYHCNQSDIDLFAQPELDAVYACTDSGAIYKGTGVFDNYLEKVVGTRYQLIDISNKKENPLIRPLATSCDLQNFVNKKYRILEVAQNLLYRQTPFYDSNTANLVKEGERMTASANVKYDTRVNCMALNSVDIALFAGGSAIKADDIQLGYINGEEFVKIYGCGELATGQYSTFTVSIPDVDTNLVISMKGGTFCLMSIVETKWNLGVSGINLPCRLIQGLSKGTVWYEGGKKETIYDSNNSNPLVTGVLGGFDTNKYNRNGYPLEILRVKRGTTSFISWGRKYTGALPYDKYSQPFFVAELYD